MTNAFVYLDESGDLGWNFTAPYRRGGSSRFLTVAALCTPAEHRERPKRLVRSLYSAFKWKTGREKKWTDMAPGSRLEFCRRAASLTKEHSQIRYFVITAFKPNVQPHIREDANKLYNYMIRLMLPSEMIKYDKVTFVPDERSIKVASGNSLHDYLQIHLWFEMNKKTTLDAKPSDSSKNQNVQFADMLAGAVHAHHEDGNSEPWQIIRSAITEKKLYF